MKELNYENINEFCDYILDNYKSEKCLSYDISVIVKEKELNELIHYFTEYYHIAFSEIVDDEYKDEYMFSLFEDSLWIEPMITSYGSGCGFSDELYIFDDCNTTLLEKNTSEKETCKVTIEKNISSSSYETAKYYGIGFYVEDKGISNITVSVNNNGVASSYSYYTSDAISKNEMWDFVSQYIDI